MSRARRFLTQRHVWPVFLAVALAVLVGELTGVALGWWGWLPGQLHSTLTGAIVVGVAMTAFTRQIGPVQEAYRLGMIAGARQERLRIEHERSSRRVAVAVGGHEPARPVPSTSRTRMRESLTLVRHD